MDALVENVESHPVLGYHGKCNNVNICVDITPVNKSWDAV